MGSTAEGQGSDLENKARQISLRVCKKKCKQKESRGRDLGAGLNIATLLCFDEEIICGSRKRGKSQAKGKWLRLDGKKRSFLRREQILGGWFRED